ncbi:TetR/AcrR family transcriptional regulator [Phaeobacter sp. 11ANDIMAR09]|uniref:TetR/AcrR family transcriptional regulator n=1 Tax=Phaeobacter sp. 11ANDIMAR09 TaxID=1225647 RepID=UPI0006C8823B|nr:TetR/AcrR family transcriptional regulator [Phaeobacter sp. 11ANDIMAR09]KPD11686.1 hypothetical protein AN476_14650 [Phaeobacter sp. 11ANDIMAR09]
MSSAQQTQKALLRVARDHFAARGYQGTSLAQISAELGITKQGLLHHFGSKERLYRAVLGQLNQDLLQLLFAAMDEAEDPEDQLERFFVALADFSQAEQSASALVIGALIDGPGQAIIAQDAPPPLQDFLEPLVALVQATARWQKAGFPAALSIAMKLLGATCLFPAVRSSLALRFGPAPLGQAEQQAGAHLRDLVRRMVLE